MDFDLLYPNQEQRAKKITNTAFYESLGFDSGLFFGASRLFGKISDENRILEYVTSDVDTIKYRLEVFEDFENSKELRNGIAKVLPRMNEFLDSKYKRIEDGDITSSLYSVGEIDLYYECLETLQKVLAGVKDEVKSRAIKGLTEYMTNLVNDAKFKSLKATVDASMQDVKGIKSVTIGVNLDAQLRPIEAGVVSVNGELYKSGNVVDKMMRLEFKDDGFFCGTPLERTSKNMSPEETNAFYDALNSALNTMYRNGIKKWGPMVKEYLEKDTNFIDEIFEQLSFYVAGTAMFEKLRTMHLPICKPQIQPKEENACHLAGIYNPLVAIKENMHDVVRNSLVCDKYGKIYILTGPMKSGKTFFTDAVGICQVLLQLGMYLPCESATISPVDNILAHSTRDKGVDKSSARVEAECEQIGNIVKDITASSLVIMDDPLDCASNVEASYLVGQVVLKTAKIGARGLFTTSLIDIAEEADDINANAKSDTKVDTLVAQTVDDKPSFRIERVKPESSNVAKSLAKRFGIEA